MAKKAPSKQAVIPAVVAITLSQIVAAGEAGLFTPLSVHGPLVDAGLVEINPAFTDADGNVATRATAKGIETVAAENQHRRETDVKIVSTSTEFEIEDVPVSESSGRGVRANKYPFDRLEVGQSFFVADTPEKPNMAKSLASTVSSANARYSEEVDGQKVYHRRFKVEASEKNGVTGARIGRIK